MATITIRSLDDLTAAVKNNELLPTSSPAHADYGFANCTTEDDEEDLFNLYTTLITIVKCDIKALHEACGQGKLAEFIEGELTKGKQIEGYFGEWFMKNKNLLKNQYTK